MNSIYASVPLTQGKSTKVDIEDLGMFEGRKWRADRVSEGQWYARRWGTQKNGERHQLSLHNEIMEVPDGMLVDHKNGDGLDNRRDNLRVATQAQNSRNRRKKKPCSSQYKGVSQQKNGNWSAYIHVNSTQLHLGTYPTDVIAAKWYDYAAMFYFGSFALLNFPIKGDFA